MGTATIQMVWIIRKTHALHAAAQPKCRDRVTRQQETQAPLLQTLSLHTFKHTKGAHAQRHGRAEAREGSMQWAAKAAMDSLLQSSDETRTGRARKATRAATRAGRIL